VFILEHYFASESFPVVGFEVLTSVSMKIAVFCHQGA
jgi:hypothetical protein